MSLLQKASHLAFRRIIDPACERLFGSGVRPSDVFLVGYPRSGNTWTRYLLVHALFKKHEEDEVTLWTLRNYIPNLTHIRPPDPMFLGRYFTRLHPRIFCTFSPFDTRIAGTKIIYILRDPRDVLASFYHFHRRTHPGGFTLTIKEFLALDTYYPCCWDEHAAGWLLADHEIPNMMIVRYEELRLDPAGTLSKILTFIGAPFTEADVQRAVAMSSFERMRKLDEKYTLPKMHDTTEYHARKGRVGSWREELDAADLALIASRYGDVARQVGYPLSEEA